MSNNPFEALAALKASLPDGESAENTAPASEMSRKAIARLFYERKGRGGKEATIIEFEGLDDEAVSRLAADLKKSLGTGGSVRANEILLQGDRRNQVRALLLKRDMEVKG